MKIAIEANVLCMAPTGVAKSLIYLINNVHKICPSLEFILFSNKPVSYSFDFPTTNIVYKNSKLGRMLLKYKLRNCDWVHYHWNGGIVSSIKKHKNIVMIHDVLPLDIPDFFPSQHALKKYKEKLQKDINEADILLTPSVYSKNKICDNFLINCGIFVLKHGLTAMPILQNKDKSDYYIYAGGYHPRKGLIPLLEEFVYKCPHRKLHFVGEIQYFSSDFKRLVNIAEKQNILVQHGYVDERTLANLISNARALIYPSKYEGFGLPPLEAMQLGTPVFTTKYTSIPEVCGDAAIYFEPDCPGDLTRCLDAFESSNPSDMIERGYDVVKNFDWVKTANDYLDILKNYK